MYVAHVLIVTASQNDLHHQKHDKEEEVPGKGGNSNPDRIHPWRLGLPPLCDDQRTHRDHSHPTEVIIRKTPPFRTTGLIEVLPESTTGIRH